MPSWPAIRTKPQPLLAAADLAQHSQMLRHFRLFQDVINHPDAIDQLAAVVRLAHFVKDTPILREGEDGSEAYFLTAGSVRVMKSFTGREPFPVAQLLAKDYPFFGEAALLQHDTRSATIYAETDCSCLILQKDDFDRFCLASPEWALPVVRRIACFLLERLHRANNDVVLLYNALVSEVKGWNG